MLSMCCAALLLSACQHDTTVKLKTGGAVEGSWYQDQVDGPRLFLGIPYAEPPVGDLRFAPPKPIDLKELVEAKAHGASCIQNPGALSAPGELSEDCLTLNVYTPAMEENEHKLPVMVWIHGGAFVAGGSVQYDAINLAKDNNVIVVTMNYRLGALGFFSHPDLDIEQGKQIGNVGLLDQQLAMKWVKQNIKRFGGDNNNITLFGESAGSMSTCTHMVAPSSQDLANRFIMQSGVCVGGGLAILPKAVVEANSTEMGNNLCPDAADKLACLRSLPAEQLMAWGADRGIFGAGWGPTIVEGGDFLPESPTALIAKGQYNKGGVITGTNLYEWSLFQAIGSSPNANSIVEFNAIVDATYPPQQAAVLKVAYAPPVDALANVYLSTLITDQVFRCPARTLASMVQETGTDAWLYSFEQNNPAHAYELPYVFNYVSVPFGIDPTNSPTKDVFQDYWTGFAANGTPNVDAQPFWPNFDRTTQEYMIIKDAPAASAGLSAMACDLWDSFAAVQ